MAATTRRNSYSRSSSVPPPSTVVMNAGSCSSHYTTAAREDTNLPCNLTVRIKKDSALLAGFSLMAAHTLNDFLTGDLYRISCTVYQIVREKCMKLLPEVLLVKWIKPARRIETQ